MMLVPYVQIDGKWTVADVLMSALWDRIARDGLHHVVFYDGSITELKSFLKYMQSNQTLVVVSLDENGPNAVAWLTEIAGHRAFAHFCFTREVFGSKAREIGKEILDYWWMFKTNGVPVLELILGITPETNAKAVKYAQDIGFTRLGSIPRICRGKDGPVTGVLNYLERPNG